MDKLEEIKINDTDSPVAAAAVLEAMITFQKRQEGSLNAESLHLEPRVVKTKEQIFNFGRIFAMTLRNLESGKRKLPREIQEMFDG